MKFYSEEEAERVAQDYFAKHYHEEDDDKWGGFILSDHSKRWGDHFSLDEATTDQPEAESKSTPAPASQKNPETDTKQA